MKGEYIEVNNDEAVTLMLRLVMAKFGKEFKMILENSIKDGNCVKTATMLLGFLESVK